MSLRTQLIGVLGVLVLVAIASLGSIAYRTSRIIIQQDAVRDMGVIATVRKQVLIRMLSQQRIRAEALLKTADVGCLPEETGCLRKLLVDFVATEGATAARLAYLRAKPAMAGKDAAALASVTPPLGDQIAHFEFDEDGQPFYVMQVTSADGKAVLTMRGDMRVANEIFLDRYGLGASGESFLTDEVGFFLTPPKYPNPDGERRPVGGRPIETCLHGTDGEILGQSYNGIAVIHAFRHVPEIGGGCIVANIDQAEAFEPTKRVEKEVAGVSGVLALLAIGYSLMLAQIVSRPLKRLTGRARSLQQGDFDSPLPVEGPAEVRMFARTFEAMAASLQSSRSALQESAGQIRDLLASIGDSFAAFDHEWRCTYVNDKATELCRIPRAQILGKNVWDLFPNSANTIINAELRRAMEDRVPVQFEEYYPAFDIWLEVNAYPAKDGLSVFARDVTQRRLFQERLEQTQKLESLGVLAGGIAHDFNNLLTGIIGNASIARDDLPPSHAVRGGLDAVINAGERAATLTGQLLAYAGKGRFVIERLSISDLVREISSLLRASIPRTVQLHLDLEERLPAIEGDAAQLQQVIMNLVMNAAEAIEEGKTDKVRITTRLEHANQAYIDHMMAPNGVLAGKYVTLEVRDAGSGMDEATRSRIFDPFFTTKFTGRGLGLAAVLGIVRGHKAALGVETAPQKGSAFKVLFPVAEGQPASLERPSESKNLDGHGTILVIDDEEGVRQTAKAALESYGYNVAVAANGKEGVNLFRELRHEIAAVLLDMTMPVMSGEEAFMWLQKIRQDVRVVLSSGYNEAEATRRFTGKGLAGFVQKPYTAARLAEAVKMALDSVPQVPRTS